MKRGDFYILKFVVNYTYAIQEKSILQILIYHGPAENDHSQKNVTDFYAKFHFPFKTASSEESTMA